MEESNALVKLQGQEGKIPNPFLRDLDGRRDRLDADACQLQRSLDDSSIESDLEAVLARGSPFAKLIAGCISLDLC
jgi:hypothetical protein